MRKKFVIIFLATVLGLIIFKADFCLAKLNEPLVPPTPPIAGEASSTLKWYWSENGGTLKQFKVLYKETGANVWTARYPIASTGDVTYVLMGLNENTIYQWRVKAEAENPENDSEFVDGPEFTTTQADAPPPILGNGSVGPLELRNPLKADTLWEAIDLVINFLILAAFAIAPILIIYSAFLMIFAAGDAEKVNKGKSIISWTLVALAIVLFAKMLPSTIKGIFISQ